MRRVLSIKTTSDTYADTNTHARNNSNTHARSNSNIAYNEVKEETKKVSEMATAEEVIKSLPGF